MTGNVSAIPHPAKSSKVGLGYAIDDSDLNSQFIHTLLDSTQREIHRSRKRLFCSVQYLVLQSLLAQLPKARALLFLTDAKEKIFELLVRGLKEGRIIFSWESCKNSRTIIQFGKSGHGSSVYQVCHWVFDLQVHKSMKYFFSSLAKNIFKFLLI